METRIPSVDPCEIYADNVLCTYFPHAYIAFERNRIGIGGKVTLPDFVFCLPGYETEVFLEFTKSPYLPWHDKKKRQREILQEYVAKNTQYAALVLYLQNLASVETLNSSLEVLSSLAKDKVKSIQAQSEIHKIALKSNIFPNTKSADVKWDLLYESVLASKPT